jgi:hypothetical protein
MTARKLRPVLRLGQTLRQARKTFFLTSHISKWFPTRADRRPIGKAEQLFRQKGRRRDKKNDPQTDQTGAQSGGGQEEKGQGAETESTTSTGRQ